MMFTVSLLNQDEERKQMGQLFSKLDINNDGQVDKDELIRGYKQLKGFHNIVDGEIEKIMEELDQNGNGTIEFTGNFSKCDIIS
jgi:calcium-dependent protein kinase